MISEKIDLWWIKQWVINRLQSIKKRFSETLFTVMTQPWKTTVAWWRYLRKKKWIIMWNLIRLLTSVGAWGAAYYALFPSKVYQTKRTDRLFEFWKEDDLIKRQGMIEYGINDDESTFLIDMLAGMWDDMQWQEYIAWKGYDLKNMDTIPEDFENRALYIALRETHKMAFSPKFRIEPREGNFKHFSNGKVAYTDHRTHTLHSYYLLNKWINQKDTAYLAKLLDSKSYQNDREKLQDVFFYHFMSELSHTYALGVFKHEYLERFLDDALPGVEIVQDTFPYSIAVRRDIKDSLVHYTEYDDTILRFITRHIQKDSIYTDTLLKEDLTHLRKDVYRNTNKYNQSYREWFEDWIHEWPAEKNLETYFMNMYEKHLNRNANREMYDYARFFLGELWYLHTVDEKRGKKIMFALAKKWYTPAVRYIKKRTEPVISVDFAYAVWWKRELVSSVEMQICDTQWNIIHCLEMYDEKRVFNNHNR